MSNKKEANKRLIGKTVYWKGKSDDFLVGTITSVKDEFTVIVQDETNLIHEVSLFDIVQTS